MIVGQSRRHSTSQAEEICEIVISELDLKQRDHRDKGVDKINHPNKGGKSLIPRGKFNTQKKGYWRKVFDLWK